MTITVEIPPEIQDELAAQARAHGMEVPAYAASLIEEAVRPAQSERKNRTAPDLDRTLADMAQFSHKIPSLPEEAFSRESIYKECD